jgi:hypothetical protein
MLVLGRFTLKTFRYVGIRSYRPNTDLHNEGFKVHTRQQIFIRVMAETRGTYGGEKDVYTVFMGNSEVK